MKADRWLIIVGLILAVAIVGGLVVLGYHAAGTPKTPAPPIAATPDPALQAPIQPSTALPQPAPAPQPPSLARPRVAAVPRPARGNRTPAAVPAPAPPPPVANAVIDLPVAREALTLVGADPVANAVWVQAINDPNLSAHDRQDLIEDLNEEGFADPKKLTADDLPVIENRLALIEQLAPNAMDDVNAAAFTEAYKDLAEMYARLVGP